MKTQSGGFSSVLLSLPCYYRTHLVISSSSTRIPPSEVSYAVSPLHFLSIYNTFYLPYIWNPYSTSHKPLSALLGFSFFLSFFLFVVLCNQSESEEMKAKMSDQSSKLDRKIIERNRRNHMKTLCFKLASLLPSQHIKTSKVYYYSSS